MEGLKISLADRSKKAELVKIWQECFGDSEEYINFFLEKRFDDIKTLIASVDGKTVAAAYLMPVCAYEYGVLKKGWYGYAIGVLKKYRKNGIYAKMNEKIFEEVKRRDEFYIICPANEKLSEYYSSLGFNEYSYLTAVRTEAEKTDKIIEDSEISPQRYVDMRNEYFEKDGLILWDRAAIEYAFCENEIFGGFAREIKLEDKSFAVLLRPENSGVRITESTVPYEYLADIGAYICQKYGFEYALWTRAAYDEPKGGIYLGSMTYNIKKSKTAYLNIVLD